MTANPLSNDTSFNDLGDLFKPSQEDKRFKQILWLLCGIYLTFGIIVPFLEQVEIPREIKEQIPPQLAKVMLQEKQLPIPEKPKEIPIPEPEPELIPEIEPEKKPEEPKDKPVEQPKVQPKPNREAAKEKAQTSGLAAMKDELFDMRDAFDIKPAAQSTTLEQNTSQEVTVKRNLLAGAANKQSETLSTSSMSQTVNSDALSTKSTQQVRLAKEEVLASQGSTAEKASQASKGGQRSEAALRRTLEANKARLYSIYNRALRKDPFLQGKVMFEIEIQPNGSISLVTIKSSELNNPQLERQLTLVLKSIRFPAESVSVMKTIWAIDFLPS